MEKVITYVAFDGTEFDYEDECYEYERLKQGEKFVGQIHFFDRHKIPLKIGYYDSDDIFYAVVNTTEAAEWWNRLCEEEGTPQPFEKRPYKPGFYWYDIYDDKWKCLQEEMEKLQLLADEFQQFVE